MCFRERWSSAALFPTRTFEEDNAQRSHTKVPHLMNIYPFILPAFLTPTQLFLTSYQKPHTDNRPASNTHSRAATCTSDFQAFVLCPVNWTDCITYPLNDSVMGVLMISIQFSDTKKTTTFFFIIHSTLEHERPVLLCITCSCPHKVQARYFEHQIYTREERNSKI